MKGGCGRLKGNRNLPVTKRYLVTFTSARHVILSGALLLSQFEHFSNTRMNAYTGTIGGCSGGVCGAFDARTDDQNIRQARHGPPHDLCLYIRKTTCLFDGMRTTRTQVVRGYYIEDCASTERWA